MRPYWHKRLDKENKDNGNEAKGRGIRMAQGREPNAEPTADDAGLLRLTGSIEHVIYANEEDRKSVV